MKNMTIAAHGADGGLLELPANTGAEMIEAIFGTDTGVPVQSMTIEAKIADGKYVRITVPNDDRKECTVHIDK